MVLRMLKAKIHRATVTEACLHYEGSITVDRDLLKKAGILPFEQVDIYNVANGERFTTYALEGNRGEIVINGAAAHLARKGDRIIICAYAEMEAMEARKHKPKVLLLDDENRIKTVSSSKSKV
jgi:aspartate 1-decarboxylase